MSELLRAMTECVHCSEPILPGDEIAAGYVYDIDGVQRRAHRECALRMVLGGIGHHLDHAHWCLEEHDPDGGLSYRESARAVARMYDDRMIEP